MNNNITVEKKMNEIINKKTNDMNIYKDILYTFLHLRCFGETPIFVPIKYIIHFS